VLGDDGEVRFAVGAYDPTRPLVIDPIFAYSTFLGNSDVAGSTSANSVAVDKNGNAYITGGVSTTDFPTLNALQPDILPLVTRDAFVTKLNPAGQIVYSTYLGGTPDESGAHDEFDPQLDMFIRHDVGFMENTGTGIAVDGDGNVYVTGITEFGRSFLSDEDHFDGFNPLVQPFQPEPPIDAGAFIAKLDTTGSALVYSSYIGGQRFSEVS